MDEASSSSLQKQRACDDGCCSQHQSVEEGKIFERWPNVMAGGVGNRRLIDQRHIRLKKEKKEHRRHEREDEMVQIAEKKNWKGGEGECGRGRGRCRRTGVSQPIPSNIDLTHHGRHVPRSDDLNGLH